MSKQEEKKLENEAKNVDSEVSEAQSGAENAETDDKSADLSAEQAQNGENDAENDEKTTELLTPEEKIAELEAQMAEIRDQLLRKAADFENFRKRMNQEKAGAIEYANQNLLLDIIPVIDDFERAIIAGESLTTGCTNSQGDGTSFDAAGFLEGIKMIEKRLTGTLETKWGLKRFNSKGEPFDPNKHEALYMEKSADVSEAVVQEDLFKGYMLKDRVIRAAKVKVLMPESGE